MKGKIAFVTGGASGIGRATVRAFLSAGVRVVIVDINEAGLKSAADEFQSHKADIRVLLADLSQTERLDGVFKSAVDHFGRIDYLVNAAAMVGGTYEFLKIQAAEWDKAMLLNLKAPMLLMQAFARHAIGRGGGGRIVNVTSSSAFRAQGTRPGYGTSKAGLGTLTQMVAAQLGEHDINVNAVAPGITNTPGAENAMNMNAAGLTEKISIGPNANFFKRLTQADDVAATIVFLCSPGQPTDHRTDNSRQRRRHRDLMLFSHL